MKSEKSVDYRYYPTSRRFGASTTHLIKSEWTGGRIWESLSPARDGRWWWMIEFGHGRKRGISMLLSSQKVGFNHNPDLILEIHRVQLTSLIRHRIILVVPKSTSPRKRGRARLRRRTCHPLPHHRHKPPPQPRPLPSRRRGVQEE